MDVVGQGDGIQRTYDKKRFTIGNHASVRGVLSPRSLFRVVLEVCTVKQVE